MDFSQFAKINEPKTQPKNERPTKQIRAQWKAQMLNSAFDVLRNEIAEANGVAVEAGHFDVTQEDKVFVLRTVFNSVFGPDMTIDADGAQALYAATVEALEESEGETA